MKFTDTGLHGAFVIDLDRLEDERGFFARTFCAAEFAQHDLARTFAQCSVSFNRRAGTLRGLHFQAAPHEEEKLIRCTMGRVYDVVVDIRPRSPTYRRWFGVELSAQNRRMLYVPSGFAHGFQTLEADSELFYQISVAYRAELSRGIRWNDPALEIEWPAPVTSMSGRDAALPCLAEVEMTDVAP